MQVAQGSKMRGAKRIIGVDLNPDKLDIGTSLDNDSCIDLQIFQEPA
jgi:Zn-dependent alcohol dehydrogenase